MLNKSMVPSVASVEQLSAVTLPISGFDDT
jgi:hypothetical protein